MDAFEAKLAEATAPGTGYLLGAIGHVVDGSGKVLYNHASGRQTFAADAPPLTENNTFTLGSAGKFVTHLAALQLVDRGQLKLDEDVYAHLPELAELEIISGGEDELSFELTEAKNKITLRHLLTHSSGIGGYPGTPLVQRWKEWKASSSGASGEEETNPIVKYFGGPLAFEPGEGNLYGGSVEWLGLLVARCTGKTLGAYVQENIFEPLGLTASAYQLDGRPDIKESLLQLVERKGDHLEPAGRVVGGLTASIRDLGRLLADLVSPSSKLLKKESIGLLFEPQFKEGSKALADLRGQESENYVAPAGIPSTMQNAPVNNSLGGLFVEGELPLSHIPAGTTTWNGMPNVIWAMHRERGIGMWFATQLLPVDDVKTVEVAMEFLRGAWATYGTK